MELLGAERSGLSHRAQELIHTAFRHLESFHLHFLIGAYDVLHESINGMNVQAPLYHPLPGPL